MRILSFILIAIVIVSKSNFAFAADDSQSNNRFHKWRRQSNKVYKYKENDGIFVFYETKNTDLYRELLPKEFDMPERLVVHLFVMDFYKIDSDAEPYKEVSISLLAKYKGKEVWHCIFMPVTSHDSMIAGKIGLGLPKTLGDIKFERNDAVYKGIIDDSKKRHAEITLDTEDYQMSKTEEEEVKKLTAIPKVNLRKGKVIEMKRSLGKSNIIDVAKRFPQLLKVKGGKVTLSFDDVENSQNHPFDLKASKVISAYYLHNKISFKLGVKGSLK